MNGIIRILLLVAGLLALSLAVVWSPEQDGNLTEVLLTRVDTNCSHYATFQRHNQKVVRNENGIFMTYLWEFDLQTWWGRWRLIRSTDGGKSFSVVYTSREMGTNAPCMETDSDNNILLICTDYNDYPDMPFYYYRFEGEKNYTDPAIKAIKYGASGKFSMFFDEERDTIYLFNHYGKLFVINATTGKYIRQKEVVQTTGDNAMTQYPHVFVDQDGVVHHAWTTQHRDKYLYWDIHYAKSTDGGRNWYDANGSKLPWSIVPDDPGQANLIIMEDEFEYHTWLSNMIVKDGKVHFAYLAQVPPVWRQHYVRLDLATGQIDKRIQPFFKGETISLNGLDGFFATGPGSAPLYYVSRANFSHIGALVSYDNGDTWHDAAMSEPIANAIYSIGGCRELTPEGIIGSFTNQYGTYPETIAGDPHFIRIPVPDGFPIGALMVVLGIIGRLVALDLGFHQDPIQGNLIDQTCVLD